MIVGANSRIQAISDVTYNLDEIIASMNENTSKRGSTFTHNGDRFKKSATLSTIAKHGARCVHCGIEGHVAIPVYNDPNNTITVGLLVLVTSSKGYETILTKDHIIPISIGGANADANYQVLCSECNNIKDSTFEESDVLEFANLTQIHIYISSDLKSDKEKSRKYRRFHSLYMRKVYKKREELFTIGGHQPLDIYIRYSRILMKYFGVDGMKYLKKKGAIVKYSRKKYQEYLDKQ